MKGAVQKIGRVELDAGLGRVDLHHPAAVRLLDSGRQRQALLSRLLFHDEAMIVAEPVCWMREPIVRGWVKSIGVPLTGLIWPVGIKPRIDRQIAIGRERQAMAEDVARTGAAQVPIGVIRQVHDGGFVTGGRVLDSQLVVVRKA